MKKLYAVVKLAAVLMGTTLLLERTGRVAAAATPSGIKNVVLVHGAFADGSGWEAVFNILTKDGYTVAVVQQPETSFAEDVRFATAMIDRQPGPVVLVGHSYGGAVITEATIQKLRRLSISTPSRWTPGKVLPLSRKPCPQPARGSKPPPMATSTSTRHPSIRISQRMFQRTRRRLWRCRRFCSRSTRS
jgi:pimeloyl-ACP methyl ester carboxylesterase